MKTKILFKTILAAILIMAFISCKKSDTAKPATLSGTWSTNNWGGITGNICTWTVGTNASAGIVSKLGSQTFNFSIGDQIYSNITAAGTGTYNAMGKYTYGAGNTNVGHAQATMTLQNNNTQLYVHYAQDAATGITPPDYSYTRQ